jgi:DNA-binding NarL/FixJ family response regulator
MSKIGICIVEDIVEIREGLEQIILSSGEFTLLGSYANAEDAVEGIAQTRPDIAIVDINLPKMNGIECIKTAGPGSPATQFMMFTIFEGSTQVFEALAAGASGYLLKNTPPEKILDALRELHQGGSPMSAQIARKVVASFQSKQDKEGNETNQDLALLTTREKEILERLSKGLLYKEVAAELKISTGTVRQHIHHIYEKLHVQNRTEALNKIYGRK